MDKITKIDKILSIDFSLTGTAFIWGDTKNINYKYFSNLKSDTNNLHCVSIPKEFKSCDKLDFVIHDYMKLCANEDIKYVFLEAPSFNSSNSNSEFKSGYGVLTWFARQVGIPYLLVPPISLKLFFTGNARAEKSEMVQQAVKLYGNTIDFDSISKKHREDVSDALSLFTLGKEYLLNKDNLNTADVIQVLPLHQQQVIAKLCGREDLYKEIVKLRSKLTF
jgi:Holliday junction resolvasome RuvABC endonuclease subunit